MQDSDEYKFVISWYDQLACRDRQYVLIMYVLGGGRPIELAIRDVEKKKMFLKRGVNRDVHLEQMYKGAQVVINARTYTVVDYADDFTRKEFQGKKKRIVCTVFGQAYSEFGNVIQQVQSSGFTLTNMKTVIRDGDIALVLEFMGDTKGASDSYDLWDVLFSQSQNRMLQDHVLVCLADSQTSAIFDEPSTTARLDQYSSLLLVKPHAVMNGDVGAVINDLIQANFEVSAAQLFQISKDEAQNFTEVYDGVLEPASLYAQLVQELASGPLVAIEVRAENCVQELRKLVGHFDVELTKEVQPDSLRAKYGLDSVRNALHCTDLPEDGILECEYFFDIMVNDRRPKNSHK